MTPLRIALIAEDYYPQLGGVPEHVHHLARELDSLGHATTIVTSNMRKQELGVPVQHADVRRIGTSLVIYANGGVARITVGWRLTARFEALNMVKPPVVYNAGLLRAIGRGIDTTAWTWLGSMAGQQLFYAADFAQQQPDVARRFMVAHVQALRYVEDALFKGINRDEVIQIYVKNTTITDPALYDRMLHVYNEVDGNVNVEALDRDQDFNVRQGQQREKIDIRALVDPSFSDYAVQRLGRYQR